MSLKHKTMNLHSINKKSIIGVITCDGAKVENHDTETTGGP